MSNLHKAIAAFFLVLATSLPACSPMTQQALVSATADAQAAYACIEIADECATLLEGEPDPVTALGLWRSCFVRMQAAGCKETLERLSQYAEAMPTK